MMRPRSTTARAACHARARAVWLCVGTVVLAGCGAPSGSAPPAPAAEATTAAVPPPAASAPAAPAPAAAADAPLEGIDVSHLQTTVDWPSVARAGKAFVFVKATQGATEVDPRFTANWEGARAAGLRRGAYHYFQPGDDPSAQAAHFLRTVVLADGDLPPVLDIETALEGAAGSVEASQQLVRDVSVWLTRVSAATKRSTILYTSPGFWNSLPTTSAETWGKFPLWVSEYGVPSPRQVRGWQTWTFWQYSQAGRVPGVPAAVDLSRFVGDLEALTALSQ